MNDVSSWQPAEYLESRARAELANAVQAHKNSLRVYESLQNLNEVIGTEYGDRVLYELVQNAHDAHDRGDVGRIAISLVIRSDNDGELYVANGGNGFRKRDVEAIRNVAISAKEIGEGIGNKGLGFRSIEALTSDPRIYSQLGKEKQQRFGGYCFRFATTGEISNILQSFGNDAATSTEVAQTVPRYLVPRPLHEQPEEVMAYARLDYATVVVAPLRTVEAVDLASEQVNALTDLDVPLLLFLDRIGEIRIDVKRFDEPPKRRRLHRRQRKLGDIRRLHGCELHEVRVGQGRRFLVVRRSVDRERVLAAVKRSIPSAPQLKRWLDWKGHPEVSVAVGLSPKTVENGRFYNFLPMAEGAGAPLIGYLDAPFFTDIDRRDANLALPLNETLLEAAAETCAATALTIVEDELPIAAQAVFDLFAWTGKHAAKLDIALRKMGSTLRGARVIPIVAKRGRNEWSSLSRVRIWPEERFAVLKDRAIVKHLGVHLVSKVLDARRLACLHEMADRIYGSLTPDGDELAEWIEEFALSMFVRKSAPRTWSMFYNDLPRIFFACEAFLDELDGKKIFLDRSGKLRRAGQNVEGAEPSIFVRNNLPKGKRKKKGVPLPPATLTRRFRFLDERIILKREALHELTNAGLIRDYDPIEALAGLKTALGKRANTNRRKEALDWAFRVWRTADTRVVEALKGAGLYVPTLSGWHPADRAMFSSSWTRTGRVLESYLVAAAEVSRDCRDARDLLLVRHQDWPVSVKDAKRNWKRFLERIGVVDGLRPVRARLTREGSPTYLWDSVLRSGKSAEGLGPDWCAEVKSVSFNHPYTSDYQMKGEAWRLPGQIEHEKLPGSAREALCTLIFKQLRTTGTRYLGFEVGRFDRDYRYRDGRKLPSPLAAFLRAKPWIAANTRDGMGFRAPNECWASRTVRRGPPRFIDRVPDALGHFSDGEEWAELAFSDKLGLRDWQGQESASSRLGALAEVAPNLASNERPTFRSEYHRAWHDLVQTKATLPPSTPLVVMRRSKFEVLCGSSKTPVGVIVTEDAQRFEARILSEAGQPVLEVGPTQLHRIADLLKESGSYLPRRLDGVGVRLLVDGESFAPRSSDPFLTSQGLEWLPEVIIIGSALRGEQLERGIQSSTIDRQVRSIRVRRCESINLIVDDDSVSLSEHMDWYAFQHDALPTLIMSHDLSLDWLTLAGPLSDGLSRLIDRRLKSTRLLLSQLALYRASDEVEAPSDEALAHALDCNVQMVRDHRAALRTDLEHILHLLAPIVAYYGDAELSRDMQRDVDRAGTRFDARKWLQIHLSGVEYAPETLIDACERAANRAELRRDLRLDYARFNRVLLDLGEPSLSNEAELRQLYNAHLVRLGPQIIDRLRRHHAADFQAGNDLADYVERKELGFLSFDTDWILTRETLEIDLVQEHVSALLIETLGQDVPVKLPSLAALLKANRKVVRETAATALPVLRVWCRQSSVTLPEPWTQFDAQAVVLHLENKGILDFAPVTPKSIPALCQRASCWPSGMPATLEEEILGLDREEVEKEQKRRERDRREREIARRSIEFDGHLLDTADPLFVTRLQQLAEAQLLQGEAWFERSRKRTRLTEFQNPDRTRRWSSKGKQTRSAYRRERQLSQAQRHAMGLASEWLAYQFLRRLHGDYVSEGCWISKNRAQFFGGDKGDDSAGYDLLVKTPRVDWLYEVKSSLEDSGEFELTANEFRVASEASKDGRRRYRILYVPFVFSPDKWCVFQLPNPMGETTRNRFTIVGRGSVRLRFERR